MSEQEPKMITPQEAALQVYTTFSHLVERGDAVIRRLITIPDPDIEGQQLLAAIRPLIKMSAASPHYKGELHRKMYENNGTYCGGPYMDAPNMFFGIYKAGDLGIFDRDMAARIETAGMLQRANIIMRQIELDPETFPLAKTYAQKDRIKLQEWAESFNEHYHQPVLEFIEPFLIEGNNSSEDRQEFARLQLLLRNYSQEEK